MKVQTRTEHFEATAVFGTNGLQVIHVLETLGSNDLAFLQVRAVGRKTSSPTDAVAFTATVTVSSSSGSASVGAVLESQNAAGGGADVSNLAIHTSGADVRLVATWWDELDLDWTVDVEVTRHVT